MSGLSGVESKSSSAKRPQASPESSPSTAKKAKPEALSLQSKNLITRQPSEEVMDDEDFETPEFDGM